MVQQLCSNTYIGTYLKRTGFQIQSMTFQILRKTFHAISVHCVRVGTCIPEFSALLEHMVRLTSAMHHQVAVCKLGHFEKVASYCTVRADMLHKSDFEITSSIRQGRPGRPGGRGGQGGQKDLCSFKLLIIKKVWRKK